MRRQARAVRGWAAVVVAAFSIAAIAGCGGGGGDGGGGEAEEGSLASSVDLSGVEVTVGSKEFTEQVLLGKMLVQTLEAAGATVKDETKLTGTPVVRSALTSGKVDLYYEYTGTGWINILKNTKPVAGSEAQFEAVKKADAKNNIVWLAPAKANNTYALAANQEAVEKYGVKSISDYAALAKKDPAAANLCTASEFISRDDGLPGVEKTYGFKLPRNQVKQLDFGLVYETVGKGDPCDFAVVFATDGQIVGKKLTVLEDDKGFFPAYNIAVTIRKEVYDKNAKDYDKLFKGLSDLLDDKQMSTLNAQIDVDGLPVDKVAEDFLKEKKVI